MRGSAASLFHLLLLAAAWALLPFPAFAEPGGFRDFVLWSLPPGAHKVPLVMLVEGTGGTRQRPQPLGGLALGARNSRCTGP